MKKNAPKLIILMAIAVLVYLFVVNDLGQYLTLSYLKEQQSAFREYYLANQAVTIGAYMLIYITSAALSLPGATILTLAGGALFGVGMGLLVVSFASTIGATMAFLVARFLLKESIQSKFNDKLSAINEGIEKDGAFYLFTMRLVPAFPFFVVNMVMGLTPIRTIVFFFVSQVGMLPGTAVYVNAGTQLGQINSLNEIVSLNLALSFALLGIFPLIAKAIIGYIKSRKYIKRYKKPKKFDYNVVVIGAGSGGLVASYIASVIKAKVALVEKLKMGGDCLNTGCVPSKALIKSAKVHSLFNRASDFGFKSAKVDFDFADVMERVQNVIKKVEPHDSVERFTKLGVDCIQGFGKIISPYEVEIGGNKRVTTRSIILSTGGRPAPPPFKGSDKVKVLNSDNIWDLRKLPKQFLVIGAGPIGCEIAQCFQRLGSQVTLVQRGPRILPKEDAEAAEIVHTRMEREGMKILTSHPTKEFVVDGNRKFVRCEHNGTPVEVEFDEVLCALGRLPNRENLGLEDLEIQVTKKGTVDVDPLLRTNYPNIYGLGDLTGPYQFTHAAAHQAWFATVNALFSPFKTFKVNYRVMPWCTFTDPEVARVGLSEDEAKAKGIKYEVTTYGIDDLDRSIADGEAEGLVKVLTVPGKDKILGAMITGEHAGEYIVEYVSAMQHGFGLNKILGTIHIYPTLGEANKYAAGNWKKAHAPEGVLKWVERFHRWRRGGGDGPSPYLPSQTPIPVESGTNMAPNLSMASFEKPPTAT